MNLSCYLVDDEYHSIEILKAYIEKTPGLELKGSATNPLLALEQVACPAPPQITFLDVDMPELSGMEFAAMVSLYTKVIFTTSYPEFAIEAFEKDAADYLLKPISYERFLKAVNKVKRALNEKKAGQLFEFPYFYVKSELKGKLVKLMTADIIYIEASLNYILIHSVSGKCMAYLTMEEIAEKFSKSRFLRVHRSFMVNLERIRTLEHGQLTLDNNAVVPIGRSYKESLLASMQGLVIQSGRNGSSLF